MNNISARNRCFVFAVLVLMPCLAYAIGDSAGGGCTSADLKRPLLVAAMVGSPSELESEITKSIERYIVSSRRDRYIAPWEKVPENEPLPRALALDSVVIKAWVNLLQSCDETLLDFAAAAGNIENVKFLLAVGADPSGRTSGIANFVKKIGIKLVGSDFVGNGSTIFMRCLSMTSDWQRIEKYYDTNRSLDEYKKTLNVYSLLLKNGADLNLKDNYENTALHICEDPEAIRFFLDNGANPNLVDAYDFLGRVGDTPFSRHVYRALDGPDATSDNSLRIAELMASGGASKLVNLQRVCNSCGGGRKKNQCTVLSKLLDVNDKRIFQSRDQIAIDDSVSWRCKALLDPDCVFCKGDDDWRKHYDLSNE